MYGQDPGVTCLSYAAFALWYLGYPTQALHRSHETLTLAQDLAHPFSMAYAVLSTAMFHHLRRDGPTVQKQAESLIVLSRDQGFAMFEAWGTMLRGWALAEQGKAEEGIALIREGLAAAAPTTGVNWLLLLTEAYEIRRQAEEGLSVLAELQAMARKNGTMVHEAELYRLRGELTLQQAQSRRMGNAHQSVHTAEGGPVGGAHPTEANEAEACFLKAIKISRKQQVRSLELRATMNLARLWQSQGKTQQAHKKLSKVYHWFTEGFETKDLQEAKALLEELNH
jgi:predicted ATPase